MELEKAYSTYLGGDGEGTIAMLEASEKETDDPGLLWQLSFLKAKVLLMMGQAATAEEELIKTAQLERAFLGHSLVSLSLRGEVKIWLEDYEGATQDFAQVIKSIGAWELPFFSVFPYKPGRALCTQYSKTQSLYGYDRYSYFQRGLS